MDNIFDKIITEPLRIFFNKLVAFLPTLFSALLVFVFGLIVGLCIRFITGKVLHALRIDDFAERSGIERILLKGGVKDRLSSLLGRILGWIFVIVFLTIALGTLQIHAVEALVEQFFLYLPNIFISLVIVIIGYMLSNFFARAALIASVNAGISAAGLIGRLVRLAVFLFSLMVAFEHLGIGKESIFIAFAIIFGGVVLSLAIAFGLGGKDAAKAYIDSRLHGKQEERDDIEHI